MQNIKKNGIWIKKNGIWVFLDIEGPCALNDNAFETMKALAIRCGLGEKVGVNFYKNLSNIDDLWGDFNKIKVDPAYSAGHTLKVILPFFKAMGADSQWLYNFAKNNIRAVPNISEVLANLNSKCNVWQISTSHEWFVRAFCDSVGFDFRKARCTFVREFDKISLEEREGDILKEFMKEVAEMSPIEYDKETGCITKEEHQRSYDQITGFVWEILYRTMPAGELLRTVFPVGQAQKMEAVEDILRKFGVSPTKALYVGDSQTDVRVVQFLRGKGLTMMFNGKGPVCSFSDIMYIGENGKVIEEVADLFAKYGRKIIACFSPPREAKCGGLLAAVTPKNVGRLEKESVKKREKFRGVHIGGLS